MTDETSQPVYSPMWRDDTRAQPPLIADERTMLISYLDFHRETLALKCAGVPPERLSERAVPPSELSLHGLVRHLAGVEQWWFHLQFAGEEVEPLLDLDDGQSNDFDSLDGDVEEALAVWRAACQHSRDIVDGAASLDDTGIRKSSGEPISLRRIMMLMVAEYARHNGHADLLRERIDGATGW